MASTPTLSLDDLRAEREDTLREQAATRAKYEEDKAAVEAAFEADIQALAARLADLEAAERVLLRRQQHSRTAPNGHDQQPKPKTAEDEIEDDEAEDDAKVDVQDMT